jgi:hypothetical protein
MQTIIMTKVAQSILMHLKARYKLTLRILEDIFEQTEFSHKSLNNQN